MTGTSGGSNILRGGKRAYECKTLVGNYVEEAYRPNAITSSWSGGANYETSTKSQMTTGIGITMKEFGGGLKKFEDRKYDYNQLIGADKTRSPSTWKTLTQSAHSGTSQPTEFAAPREMKGRQLSPDELEKHRERWTHEKEEVRNMRYVTEMSATCDKAVKPHFRRELTTPTQVSYK